jgi:hypothetical protein
MASEIENPLIRQLAGDAPVRLLREVGIRKQGDSPTIAMLDLWHSLCKEKLGTPIEVAAGNRRECKQLSSFRGELNTSYPKVIEGKVVLVLWLESVNKLDPIILTHEIGHRVLILQGMRAYEYTPNPNCDIETLLNSLAHHPHLYALQRRLGHEPQNEIDSRAEHDIHLFSKDREQRGRDVWIQNALMLADDILNCSEEYNKRLKSIVKRKHRNTAEILNKILEIAPHYSPLSSDRDYRPFRRPVQKILIKELQLGTSWRKRDEIKLWQSLIEQPKKSKR